MYELLNDDDKSIRSLILNDVLEKVPIDESYENLCIMIGNDAIAFYDFQFWYYRFLSGKQELDFDRSSEPEPLQFSDLPAEAVGLIVGKLNVVEREMLRKVSKPLRELIEKQKIDRSYILNDVLANVPIAESYENLCKVIGNDAIAFYDFQFWYYRFLSGKQDLDFDRSSEPEPLQFSNLPVYVVGLIVDKLKVVERLMLRRVSKSLQEFIEKQVFDIHKKVYMYIDIGFGTDLIRVWYGSGHILYAKNDEAVKFYEKDHEVCGAPILYGEESEVCDDLACVLKNPKLRIFEFDFSRMLSCVEYGVLSAFLAKFEYTLKSLEHQITVKKFSLRAKHPDDVLTILPYLKPGDLEVICIHDFARDNRNHEIEISDWKSDENSQKVKQIMQLEQWKQAKELCLEYSLHLFPDEVLVQFENYKIITRTLDQSQLDRIKMIFATSPVFKYCYLSVHQPSDDYDFYLIGVPGPPEGYYSVRHYMIPNTNKMLVFKQFTFGDIEIEKRTRRA